MPAAPAVSAQDDVAGGILLPPGVEVVESQKPEPGPLTSSYEPEAITTEWAGTRLPWTTSTWSGLPQWRCTLCPFDTLDGEDAMIVHIEARHGAAPAVAPLVQAYDARGNPI